MTVSAPIPSSHPITLQIEGMTCAHCTSRIEEVLNDLPFVETVDEVSLDTHSAIIALREPLSDPLRERLTESVEDAGFDLLAIHDTQEGTIPTAGVTTQRHDAPDVRDPVDETVESAPPEPPSLSSRNLLASTRIELDVRGMTCASCVARVERALDDVPGTHEVVVNYATERATVVAAEELPGGEDAFLETLENAVESAGYEVASSRILRPGASTTSSHTAPSSSTTSSSVTARHQAAAHAWRRRFLFGLVALPPILLLQMGPMWFDALATLTTAQTLVHHGVVAYLTLMILVVSGRPFFEGAWSALRHKSANMDTLVALGAGVAFLYSLGVTINLAIQGPASHAAHVYYDGAAMIVTLIGLGKWLEVMARGAASASLEALMTLSASHATVWDGAGSWVERPVNEVKPGDRIAIKPGEKVPLDATILEGQADVNEAMLTGESVPVTRKVGDAIMAATINVDGYLEARVERAAGDTVIAGILREVEQTMASKADIQRLADKVSSIFVPIILLVALLTLIAWMVIANAPFSEAISPAIAVLVVACPCALGLATPTALMVGSSRGAKSGILIREANALEMASRMDAILFDKTGTLTSGKMRVVEILDFRTSEPSSSHTILALAARLEAGSEHPLAAAVLARATEDGVEPSPGNLRNFKVIAGHGVEASLGDTRYRLGKPGWLATRPDGPHADRIDALRQQARTTILLADEHDVIGAITLEDSPREEAREAVERLQKRGVQVWMVTGDDTGVATAMAEKLGIASEHVKSQVLPSQKAEILRGLQEQGMVVGMVGDGINDAPALAQADLGIAMGSGTDVAMETASMVLVSHNLNQVVEAVFLAQATYAKIRQNLFWAFLYNTVLVPVAALGFLMPALAAGAMALSSVSVVSNSLLLRSKRLDR